MNAGEARDHGRMVTPSGAGTSGDDDPVRGKRIVTGIPCLVHYFRLGRVDPNLCACGGVDVYVLVSDCGKWCDIYRRFSLLVVIPVRYNFGDGLIVVAVRDLCEISDQASGLVPVSAKRVRTLLRKRDRYSFSKCHKRMSTRRNKCILVLNTKLCAGMLNLKNLFWIGSISVYGWVIVLEASLERELSRLGEKWQFWAVDTV
ncbi:hypothetical protein Lal_00042990 [Lupinus albus]|nr:hypothetical protein Lal_00042990 [Lupinus albus]